MFTATVATFLGKPISIETSVGQFQNLSTITVTSQSIDPSYMDNLHQCLIEFCDWVMRHHEHVADCHLENNQVVCTIRMWHKELVAKVLPELRIRLWKYEVSEAVTSGGGRRMTMQRGGNRQQDCSGDSDWLDLV